MADPVLATRLPATQLRLLHSLHAGVDGDPESELVSWTSSPSANRDEQAAIQAFVELVSRICTIEPGEAVCIQHAARGGYVEAQVGSNGLAAGNWSFVPYDAAVGGELRTDFSIGLGKALQLHTNADGTVRLVAQSGIVPQPALNALGEALQDILMHQSGTETSRDNKNPAAIAWTQPSVLNWPPRQTAVGLWPGDAQAEPTAVLLHSWFEQRVRDGPDRIALDFLTDLETGAQTQFTYGQVSNAANALAAKLQELAASSDQKLRTVAVAMGPCPELYISYLGSLKAGLAFCPLPVDAPKERRAALLADLKPVAILVPDQTLPESAATEHTTVNVSPFVAECDSNAAPLPYPLASSDSDAAYVLYTSGTTGLPKGVVVSHRSAACTVSALGQHYGFRPDAERPWRWFQGAAPTFDISLFEIFWTLSTGSTLCCAPRHLTMQNIDAALSALQADITNVTPSFASLISPSVIRSVMVGGETLNSRLVQDFSAKEKTDGSNSLPYGIYNGYGPTEVAIYSLAQPHIPANQRGSVIGSPLATCGVLIVEPDNSSELIPVPQGAVGELVLTGPQVSSAGYLNRPEETRKAFVDDPKWGRAYRTGDRASIVWNEKGEAVVDFLGRLSDEQVKLSGRRVELGEIEDVLASRARGVHQTLACVWKKDASLGSERVVSLVVVDSKSGLDFSTVHAACADAAQNHLPDYMRPFRILQVDELPRSASGKVNRRAAAEHVHKILQLQQADSTAKETTPEPETVLENANDAHGEAELVRILSNILGIGEDAPVLTATTKLADAGVDSLRAMRLLREIRKNKSINQTDGSVEPSLAMLLDPEASIRSVFFASAAATVAVKQKQAAAQDLMNDFAARHSAAALERLSTIHGPLSGSDVEMVLPLTSTASQLAVSFAMDRGNYISHTVLHLRSDVSASGIETAICTVLERHPVYRSAIVPCSDDLSPFAQVVLTPAAWQRWTAQQPRVVHSTGSTSTGDTQQWIDIAHNHLDFDLQQLYYVQIVEPEDAHSNGLVIISMAHCLCDGASTELLLADIAREYAGLEPLDRLSVQHAVLDWAANVNAETDRHWQDSLRDWEADSFHALSGNNVKAAVNENQKHDHALASYVSSVSWALLDAKSRSLDASPLSVLQAAWSLLLKVWSEANTEDVVFGSVVSSQHKGCHASTFSVVPCRVPLPQDQTVQTLLTSLVNEARFAQSHRHTSFGVFGALPYNTVLALQAYESTAAENGDEEVTVPWEDVHQPAIRYDFDVFAEVLPQAEALVFKITYRADALSETSAGIIARQFAALVHTLLSAQPGDDAQHLLAQLPHDLLSVEGTIPTPEPLGDKDRMKILHAQFEDQAVTTPDKLALSFYSSLDAPPTNLTYAELDARANGLAHILRKEDAGVIPICMHRSVELYVSILSILKAGSAWSPIDETSPVQRRTSLIARTQGKVLLTTTDSYSLVEPCLSHEGLADVRVILVDQYADQSTTERPTPRTSVVASPSITGQDLAYLLWTSGTTGEPKGVMIQHFAAANAMRDLQVRVEHDAGAGQVRTLQLSSYSFDVFVQDLFYTWGLAGSVITGTRELVLGTFTEFVKTARPTHAHLTPSFGASIDVSEMVGSTLRYVTFIGEKLTEDVAEAWAAPAITTKAYNTYGPAENAVVSTMRQFYGKGHDRSKAANVGFPLTPCTAYVVREVGGCWELVPRYGVGELALGGAQVAQGYLNNEAKTTKSFVQGSPKVDGRIGERIYLTGDMVRLNDHGFEFLGRNDDLVKITGIRIELSEISAACALVKEDEPALEHVETLYLQRPGSDASNSSNKVIVTFVSVKDSNADTNKIRQQVFQKAREVLPAYMVPGHVVVLDTTMPRTASNKVDRKALQAIYAASDLAVLAGGNNSASGEEKVEVKWDDEQLPVVQAIADNLAVPLDPLHPMGPDDSLAGLGFSSLQITKLSWALRKALDCDVRVLDLMRCRTVGELVDVVLASLRARAEEETKKSAATAPATPPVTTWVSALKDTLTEQLHGPSRPASTTYVLPATPVQEALLVETMVEPGAYWSHRLFDLSSLGVVNTDRLQAAWAAAAARLDILRTVFVPLAQLSPRDAAKGVSTAEWARSHGVHAAVIQFVLEKADFSWTELENSDVAAHARKIQVDLTPLGDGSAQSRPPWAVAYSPTTMTLMLSMHHALYDGESSRMLLEVVAKLYQNPDVELDTDTGGAANLRLLPLSRGLELGLLSSVVQRDEASAAWTKHIHSLVDTDGAVNAPFPDLTGSRQPQAHAILSAKATIPAEFLAPAADRPDLPRLVLSAFGCVLAAILEVKTIVLGQTVSQRILHSDLARVVGPAVATLPVAIRTHAASAIALWAEMGRAASSLGALAHHLHPVDIKKMVNEGSGDPHAPFPALFVYHPASDEALDDSGVQTFNETGQALSLHVEHPMALNVFEGERLIELTGDARRISQPMLDLVLAQILDQARAMLAHPDMALSQLSNRVDRTLVSVVGEPKELVGTAITRNPADLVTKQAREHPDWLAIEEIVLDDETDHITTTAVTYRELEELVNAVAAQLTICAADKTVPGDVVALYLERDIKSLAAIIAVFKLGYIYLPIDGDLPAARKQLLVRDANAKMVISTKSLVGDLGLDQNDSAPAMLLLPEGHDELDAIRSWTSFVPPSVTDTVSNDNGGYLLYTSGSTGRPKGVRVTNESLLHYVAAMTQRLAEANPDVTQGHLGGQGKFLNVASRAFDTHLTTMFAPWHLGFCSVIGRDRNAIFASLPHVINTVGITNMGTVPSVLLQLGLRLEDVPSIRVMTFGGEKASHELFDQLGGDLGGDSKAALMNFYGPTEAAVGCMSHVVGHHSNARNLGLPLPGLEALLLVSGSGDDAQIVARRGQPGELCIAGPQVAVGYLDRPDETAKSFQYTTLLGSDGSQKRIYRTGDMMRMMHDGTVEFLGRRDQQTKIRGQRFEIGEVEAHIKKSIANLGGAALDIAAAVVDQRLVGLVARKQAALLKAERDAPAELLFPPPGQACRDILAAAEQSCRKDLPTFMVPEMFWLSKMPFLSASGKLDTKQIMQLVRDADNVAVDTDGLGTSNTVTPAVAQLTGPEREVLAALAEVLGGMETRTVSASSNLRGLGIDSLSGVHLLSVLKRRGFTNVVLTDLLSPSGSIHSLSLKFNGTAGTDGSPPSPPKTPDPSQSATPTGDKRDELTLAELGPCASHMDPANISAILPCLPLQSSLVALSLNWLHNIDEETDSQDVPYVTQFNYQLEAGADIAAWRQAVEQVVSSEVVLRTCFVQRDHDGQVFQVVLSSPPSPFVAQDNGNTNNSAAAELVVDMDTRPPVRMRVDGHQVSLLIHHALYDGAAIIALRIKIEQAYHCIISGMSAPPSLTNDSLATLRRLAHHCSLSGQDLETTKAAWQAKMKGITPCRIIPRGVGQDQPHKHLTSATARVTRRFAYTAAELKSKLQLPSSLGWSISASTAFHTATVLVLASLTSSGTSVVYGNTTSLRPLLPHIASDIDSFVGPCLNTVVHALPLADTSETLPSLASRVAKNHTDVTAGQMPFVTADLIQRWASIDGKLFDSLLTINVVSEPAQAASVKSVMHSLPGKAKLDLALTIDVDVHLDGQIELLLGSAGALSEQQLEAAGRLFETVVENCANAGAAVDQFVTVSMAETGTAKEATSALSSTTASNSTDVVSDRSPLSDGSHAALASVSRLVCQLLHLTETDIPADTSLYRLGLDSINVLPFVKLLKMDLGIKVTPNAVLRARTLQGIASLVHTAKSKDEARQDATIAKPRTQGQLDIGNTGTIQHYDHTLQQVAQDLLFVATPLQEGMLSASFALADQAYTYTHMMQLSAPAMQKDSPNFKLFFAAMQDTVLSCEILRTRFVFTDNSSAPWVGVVLPNTQSDLVSCTVSATGVVRLRIHHALYDAGSIQAMWRLLGENYAGRLVGAHHKQTQQRYLYRPFSRQVSVAQDSAVGFWVDSVKDYNYAPLALECDISQQLHASASFHFSLDASDLTALHTTCRKAGVALKTALQLAWGKVLCETLYQQSDVVFGEVITMTSEDDDAVIMGPAINTVPMRIHLSPSSAIADALSQLQSLGDQARGPHGMASLRDVQTAWRLSRADGVDTSAGLFQSLFVFDGDVSVKTASTDAGPFLPGDVTAQVTLDTSNAKSEPQAPLYDDYPLITSFRIRDGVLHSALRAKVGNNTVQHLGSQLQTALQTVASCSLQDAAIDSSAAAKFMARPAATTASTRSGADVDMNGSTELADAVLQLAKKVVGTRLRGGKIGYATKLINVGLDSISAIRFASLLKKELGIHVSIFDIIKGASAESIVRKHASTVKPVEQAVQEKDDTRETTLHPQQARQPVHDEALAKSLVVANLGLPSADQIKSVLPVLAGQRHTLQHWLHSGKRFFEAPWVFRISEDKHMTSELVAGIWNTLCATHDILQTTFVALNSTSVPDLVQATLRTDDSSAAARFNTIRDDAVTIQDLIETHVCEGNSTPSDLRTPPSRLAFLEANDGQAIVLRVHHALYDAWSIKLVLDDLGRLFQGNMPLPPRPSLQFAVQEVVRIRSSHAEQAYWEEHLAHARDTILQPALSSSALDVSSAPLGPHFKASHPDILSIPPTTNKTKASAALLAAYAQALGHVTGRTQPTFGLNYAARSLASPDGEQTLDLTEMSLPTMAVVPMTVNLDGPSQQVLDSIQGHLAELTKFAQADQLHKLAPSYNTHINILFADNANDVDKNTDGGVLQRHRLGEPLASEYFTTVQPLATASSTVDSTDISWLPREQLYFNVLVRNGSVGVNVSGDQDFVTHGGDLVDKLVGTFKSSLVKTMIEDL
ncbi:NRPS [Sporothrix curviconia]|uniref:NRPS n=1 Tax=Sporothrix curviconia TaxID=1260050 RepID=A0ABP0B6C9_9PEZI